MAEMQGGLPFLVRRRQNRKPLKVQPLWRRNIRLFPDSDSEAYYRFPCDDHVKPAPLEPVASEKREQPPQSDKSEEQSLLEIVVSEEREQQPQHRTDASDRSKQQPPPSLKNVARPINNWPQVQGGSSWDTDLELGIDPGSRHEPSTPAENRGSRCSRMGEAIARAMRMPMRLLRYLFLGSPGPATPPRYDLFSDNRDALEAGAETMTRRREVAKEWCKQVADALLVSQGLSRVVYAAVITFWTSALFHRPATSSDQSPVPTRAVVGMAFEMVCAFLASSLSHYVILSSHMVQTSALHISREAERTTALMMLAFTDGWIITYTLHVSPVVYRDWMWGITSIFLLINLRNTILFGCLGRVKEDQAIHTAGSRARDAAARELGVASTVVRICSVFRSMLVRIHLLSGMDGTVAPTARI